ncbi:type IV pili methyl-accepting chemotaxis transducer N-terminal domain-containing protein [Rhodoferax sp. BAB1]|uniref:type IV pili methyl-accepting chemotaxis transducer N-terminal domain-containing protein n=1 Tax=Rhodoferax sp. BAB1 TaxID=2741720 RepID=UPI0015762322|nr:type IV pili methyl-accepting chemotaxis transducer N-terminal domain-containing protein [Rhodoferax sp. BAB1]QKO22345.1 type IV pili methyl-accepting chemotaxis transducer N-terminal domain-containing protein [Rhodoferax sp. BAB1]
MNHLPSTAVTPHTPRAPGRTPAIVPAHITGLSLVNLAARQRMLSQRMILQTILAARGDAQRLAEAQRSLQIFTESQQHLLVTTGQLEAASAQKIRTTYDGVRGVGPVIETFMQLMRRTLEQIERKAPGVAESLIELVGHTDRILEALNTATTAFDDITKAKSEAMMKELAGIVGDIQSVAKEAKVVSFNAQIMAARAGQHGREFAVVANVLSDITGEIDGLTRKAAVLADRNKHTA